MAIDKKFADAQLEKSKEKRVHRIKVLKKLTIVEAVAWGVVAIIMIVNQADWVSLALVGIILSKVYQNWLTEKLSILQQSLLDDFAMLTGLVENEVKKKGKK
jgi:uncharacterized membrane protein